MEAERPAASGPMVLRRGARVESVNGGAGRLEYVILDPKTHDATDLAVRHEGTKLLVPLDEIAEARNGRILLRGAWSRYRGRAFNRDDFQVVPLPVTRPPNRQTAPNTDSDAPASAREGAALLMAGPDEVQIGTLPRPEKLRAAEPLPAPTQDDVQEQGAAVRVSRRVVQRIEVIEVPVTEEHALVERLPGSAEGSVWVGDRELLEGETLDVTLTTERLSVARERVALEDVHVHTRPATPPGTGAPEQESAPPSSGSRRPTASAASVRPAEPAPRDDVGARP